MSKIEFYICRHCGNLVGMIHNAGVPMICCGEKMSELIPDSIEASEEKHVPAVTVEKGAFLSKLINKAWLTSLQRQGIFLAFFVYSP